MAAVLWISGSVDGRLHENPAAAEEQIQLWSNC